MPLKQKFAGSKQTISPEEQQKRLYQRFGIVGNPFPNAAQTTGHPRMPLSQDDVVDDAVMTFYNDRQSQAIAITASQGVGKTNLLNAYAQDLQEVLSPKGFFVIRYMSDPESSFDPLVRSLFEMFHEHDLLKQSIIKLTERLDEGEDLEEWLDGVRMPEMKALLKALVKAKQESEDRLEKRLRLAQQWLLGLPVRKEHQTELGVHFRLDTVESKTRALRDTVYFSANMKTLEGIFLLLDELEKQGSSLTKVGILQYLSALRALIDALPRYLFLMVALTTDALNRYREMLPALKGRLAREVNLPPLRDETQAIQLMQFYWQEARERAASTASRDWGKAGNEDLVDVSEAKNLFRELLKQSTIQGVRQREFLNALAEQASKSISAAMGE